jgi:hypothetical protein
MKTKPLGDGRGKNTFGSHIVVITLRRDGAPSNSAVVFPAILTADIESTP